MTLAPASWTLDGKPVDGEMVAASAALGGYDRATVDVPANQCRHAEQGSVLQGWLETGEALWEGRLALPPHDRARVCRLEGAGYKAAAEKAHGRLPYQIRDLSSWVDATGPPHNYAAAANPAAAQVSNVVQVESINPTTGTIFITAKIALWLPGAVITRYAFTMGSGLSQVEAKLGIGPSGALTTEATHPTSGEIDRTVSVATGKDLLVLELGTSVPAQTSFLGQIANLRVNGIGTTDTMTTSAMVADVAARLGWDAAGVKTINTNALPHDVVSGSWDREVLDYAAGLDDWVWRVLDDRARGPYLEYAPWGERTWVTQLAYGATEELIPQEVFNQVMVTWFDDGGAPHSVIKKPSPDPLARSGLTNTFEVTVPDRQADDALAQAVALTLLPVVSAVRWRGPVRLVAAEREGGGSSADPRLILPGDHLRISDWDQGEDVLLRVYDAEPDEEGASLAIDHPASAGALLGRAGLVASFIAPQGGLTVLDVPELFTGGMEDDLISTAPPGGGGRPWPQRFQNKWIWRQRFGQ